MIRRFIDWLDSFPTLHKHEVSELTETLHYHREEDFSWTTLHRRWWCPICKRSWEQWSFFTNQDRQIFNHVQKIKLEKLRAKYKEAEKEIAAVRESIDGLTKKFQDIKEKQ